MNYVAIGITLPKDIVNKIDQQRGDIPRSKYVLRLLERGFKTLLKNSTEDAS